MSLQIRFNKIKTQKKSKVNVKISTTFHIRLTGHSTFNTPMSKIKNSLLGQSINNTPIEINKVKITILTFYFKK